MPLPRTGFLPMVDHFSCEAHVILRSLRQDVVEHDGLAVARSLG